MIKKLIISLSFAFLIIFSVNAQNIKYKTVNSSEIKYAKLVYVKVFKEDYKNFPLFYSENSKNENKNLINILVDGIRTGDLLAYENQSLILGGNFKYVLDTVSAFKKLGQYTEEQFILNSEGEYEKQSVIHSFDEKEINSYIFSELWLYGENECVKQKITIGICPVREYYNEWDDEKTEPLYKNTFWIYFPDAQKFLSNQFATERNGKKTRTFEEILFYQDYEGYELSDTMLYLSQNKNDYFKNASYYKQTASDYKNIAVNISDYKFTDDNLPGIEIDKSNNLPHSVDLQNKQVESAQIIYKRVWKSDSVNFPLFYPEFKSFGFANFLDLIVGSEVPIYSTFSENGQEFSEKIYSEKMEEMLGKRTEPVYIENESGEIELVQFEIPFIPLEITSFIFQEVHFFNDEKELIQVVTTGICPIREYYREDDYEQANPLFSKTFWVYYLDLQNITSQKKLFGQDCFSNITFDDFIFNQKYFGIDFTDTVAWNSSDFSTADKIELTEFYSGVFVNLHSDSSDVEKFIRFSNQKPVEIIDYELFTKKDFKQAKIVTTKVDKKDNPNLFFPVNSTLGYTKLSDLIVVGLEKNKNFYADEEMKQLLSKEKVNEVLGQKTQKFEYSNYDLELDTITYTIPYNTEEITSFVFKELWLYNKEGEVIEKRIVAICPVRETFREDDINEKNPIYQPTFWINYTEFDDIFSENFVTQTEVGKPENYHNFFLEHKYKSSILSEKKLSKGKAYKYLMKFE
ncbi:MAG: hypothetical protein JXL97_02115 [Bacteroidales bacterium]|nr:hypothetical protein [Bacteroidales bacterium]